LLVRPAELRLVRPGKPGGRFLPRDGQQLEDAALYQTFAQVIIQVPDELYL
jgi:hypothetical protein